MSKIPKWLGKSFVAFVTLVTLGTVVPSINYHIEQRSSSKENLNGASVATQRSEPVVGAPPVDYVEEATEKDWFDVAQNYDDVADLLPHFQAYALKEAKAQGFSKFGDNIAKQVGDTYTEDILPKFADAVADLGKGTDADTLKNIVISHNPAGGTGERILNLYDGRNGRELLKLHVRRDHPPLDGYWFNFHYHTYEDHHQVHHELGKVYWDKNTPPQWQA